MNASVSDKVAILIGWEVERSNVKRPIARATVARQAGICPGALDRLERGTLKFVDRIAGRLNELYANTIRRKIAELNHELETLSFVMGSASEAESLAAADALNEAANAIRIAKAALRK